MILSDKIMRTVKLVREDTMISDRATMFDAAFSDTSDLPSAGLPHLWIKKSDRGLGASPPAGVKGAAPRRMSSFLN